MDIGRRTLLAKTCTCCNVLKQASEFRTVSKIYKCSWCNKCKNNQTVSTTRIAQRKSSEGARRLYQPWTEGDIRLLDEMVSEGRSAHYMASVLGRTVYAVYSMQNKLKKEI